VSTLITPFTDDHIPAVQEFNLRIASGGIPYRFPESPVPQWLPRRNSIPIYQEYFVALEGNKVCGGYILKPQAFACNGEMVTIAGFQLPMSEGVIDRRHGALGIRLLDDASKRQSLLFAVGMGGYHEPKTRMLKAMKWSMVSCPFYFKVNHPSCFFREISFLRRKRLTRMIVDASAFCGLAWLMIKFLQFFKEQSLRVAADVVSEEVDSFSSWADEVWQRASDNYAMVAVRDAAILNTLYPSNNERFRRLRMLRKGQVIGWAVLLNTKMNGHKHFGNMRVGSVVDCLAIPGEESQIILMATRYLKRLDADIVVTNQLHHSWCEAFANNGYLRGPSNFIFAISPELANKLRFSRMTASRVHMTRGDGDGPIHL
jgi:hypothetical protein